MERYVKCAGSGQAEANMPELPSAEVTTDGDAIHEGLADGDTSALTETQGEIAQRLAGMEAKSLSLWMESKGIEVNLDRHAEERLWIRNRQTLELIASAQLDVYYVSKLTEGEGMTAFVLDFKSGYKKATAAEMNWQLLTQAIALRYEYPHLHDVTVGIAASRLGSSLDLATYTASDLDFAERELLQAVWRAQQPNPPRSPGTWCQYCRAKSDCATAASWALIVQQTIKAGNKLEMHEAVQSLKPEQLVYIWSQSTTAKGILDAVKARLETLPAETLAEFNLHLKPGAEVRRITNVLKAWDKLAEMLPEDARLGCITIALGKVEKALAFKNGLKGEAAKTQVNAALGEWMQTKQNKPSLEFIV